MINKLVIENLKYRWVRTLLSALVVGVQVMSILVLIGLSEGLLQDSANRAKSTGADIFLKPGSQGAISFSTGQLSEKWVPLIAKQPHVAQAVGVLSQIVELITAMNGVNFTEYEKISGGFHFISGGPLKGPDDLLVDQSYAREKHLQVGQTVVLLKHPWHLAGIVQDGGMLAHFVVPLATLQDITGNTNKISQILVKLDNPALTDQAVKQLDAASKGQLQAIPLADFLAQFSINNIPQLQTFIWVITALSVVVGFLVVFLSMYTAVIERTREIGILKALGAKPFTIVDMLVREAVMLAAAGCVIGIFLSFVARQLVTTFLPASLTVIAVPGWWPKAAAIALAGALLGAIYPGLKAARQDAIEALAYE
jgi:putative ABC transport system permease protein